MKFICTLLILVLYGMTTHAQKQVKGQPLAYDLPSDYSDESDAAAKMSRFLSETTTKLKSKDKPWMVISDRSDNPYYFENNNDRQLGVVGFGDVMYVVEEKGEWVKVLKAYVDKLKIADIQEELGWMPKSHLVLWSNSLVQQGSGIHKKILLLNRADDIDNVMRSKDKTIVEIFKGPSTDDRMPDLRIFGYFYLLKVDLVNQRYLLSNLSSLSDYTADAIMGWVPIRRCSKWNSRVCLEPNFNESAFNQRKALPDKYGVKAFADFQSAVNYTEHQDKKGKIVWEDDPVTLNSSLLSKENPRRFKGGVLRFPMLGIEKSQDGMEYFRSGLIGTIRTVSDGAGGRKIQSELSEAEYVNVVDKGKQEQRRAQNVNIYFVIEGTDSLFAFKDAIIESLNKIDRDFGKTIQNIQYGALVYRDISEESVLIGTAVKNRMIESQRLTPDIDRVVSFLEKSEFQSKVDKDEWTVMYYGINEALRNAGFRESDLNVMVVIGAFGDIRGNQVRKSDAERKRHVAYISDKVKEQLVESLSKLKVHLYAFQPVKDNSRASHSFRVVGFNLILDAAKHLYNTTYGSSSDPVGHETQRIMKDFKLKLNTPFVPDLGESHDMQLQHGVTLGRLTMAAGNRRFLEKQELQDLIYESIEESVNFAIQASQITASIYEDDGKSISSLPEIEASLNVDAGRFTPFFAHYVNQSLKSGTSKDLLIQSLDEKYKLFTEVVVPRQMTANAEPSMSYIAFMPRRELEQYVQMIERLLQGGSSYDVKRKGLFEVHKELIAQLTGEFAELRKKKPEDFSREELARLMMGLQDSGLHWEVLHNFKIHDLTNEKKFTNSQIEDLMKHYKKIYDKLNDILRIGPNFPFQYTPESASGNNYYWIPVSELF